MLVLQRQGRIGFYGPILGQEGATVGSVAARRPQDWIFPALREGSASRSCAACRCSSRSRS
jgi:pyruvate dehydrogenase E1 component alpha subunit